MLLGDMMLIAQVNTHKHHLLVSNPCIPQILNISTLSRTLSPRLRVVIPAHYESRPYVGIAPMCTSSLSPTDVWVEHYDALHETSMQRWKPRTVAGVEVRSQASGWLKIQENSHWRQESLALLRTDKLLLPSSCSALWASNALTSPQCRVLCCAPAINFERAVSHLRTASYDDSGNEGLSRPNTGWRLDPCQGWGHARMALDVRRRRGPGISHHHTPYLIWRPGNRPQSAA